MHSSVYSIREEIFSKGTEGMFVLMTQTLKNEFFHIHANTISSLLHREKKRRRRRRRKNSINSTKSGNMKGKKNERMGSKNKTAKRMEDSTECLTGWFSSGLEVKFLHQRSKPGKMENRPVSFRVSFFIFIFKERNTDSKEKIHHVRS
jgi:hypothetical protein